MSNLRTVYSTDPKDKITCPKCKKNLTECRCVKEQGVNLSQVVAILRIEKKGRGGKAVTVIDKLPKNEIFLKQLTKELKSKCATGGTYRLSANESLIEIQGEKVDVIKKILQQHEIKFKGL